jgi:hypothetical protein
MLLAVKLPEASRAMMVEAPFELEAFEVTVNVLAPAWSAVNVAEPDKPVPDTFIVNVPLFGEGTDAQVWSPRKNVDALAVPEAKRAVPTVPELMFEAFKLVKLAPETAPKEADHVPVVIVPTDTKLDAVVILGCEAVVTVPAVVAVPAEVAEPLKVAVIVPAAKLPEASRATMVEAPLADAAVVRALSKVPVVIAEAFKVVNAAPEPE